MAAPQDLIVAKAVFITSMTRRDAGSPDLSRDDATLWARSILRACNICTATNVKACNSFIVRYVLGSTTRTTALATFLLTLSKYFGPRNSVEKRNDRGTHCAEGLGTVADGKDSEPPQPAYRRLHLLYIVHDILTYVVHHKRTLGAKSEGSTLETLHVVAGQLAALAVCGCGGRTAVVPRSVLATLELWKSTKLMPVDQLEEMSTALEAAIDAQWEDTLLRTSLSGDTSDLVMNSEAAKSKWILPERHGVIGDATAPWHELPAGNGLYLKRTRGYPLRASALPPGGIWVQSGGQEADAELKQEVLELYQSVLQCYDKHTSAAAVQDVDALGNIIWKEIDRPTRNYWGFSLEGIDKRKDVAAHFAESTTENGGYDRSDVRGGHIDSAIERARALAAERFSSSSRGRGFGGRRGGALY